MPSFLIDDGARLTREDRAMFLERVEPDFEAALRLLRRRAQGDFRPDLHGRRYQVAASTPRPRASGMDGWQAFEA